MKMDDPQPWQPRKGRLAADAMGKLPVLVTGGAGYIGSHAVLALRDAGWPVDVLN